MKTKTILLSFLAVTALAVVSAVAIYKQVKPNCAIVAANESAERIFDVKGKVVSVEADEKTIHIAHENIPDFMPPMTMPFSVKDAELLRGLAAGDQVKFQLMVTKDDSWIATIQKVGAISGAANSSAVSTSDNSKRVKAGDTVPDFSLLDQNGQPLKLSQFHGKAVVVTFIYTRCPIPNFCPLMSKNFSELQSRFSKKFRGQFQLLSVSFDPGFDTPAVLKNYAEHIGANSGDWSFATGSQHQIDFVADLFGLVKTPEGNGFSHDLRTALIGPDGKLVHVWRSNVWTADEVENRLGEILTGDGKLANAQTTH